MPTEALPLDKAVEIDWFAEEEIVRVLPRDQNRFEIHKDRVIRLLQLANDGEKQFQLLLSRLGEWTNEHSSELSAAYLTLRDNTFAFFAVSRSATCSDELEDAVSDLDLEIANDPDLEMIHMNATLLPSASAEALRSFFDEKFLLVFRGSRA